MSQPTGPFNLTRAQKAWLVAFWAAVALSLSALALGFFGVTWSIIHQLETLERGVDFADPWFVAGSVGFMLTGLIDLVVVPRLKAKRPVTRRFAKKIERVAQKQRKKALGDVEALILTTAPPPNTAGRMWQTPVMVSKNDPTAQVVVVTLPALGGDDRGRARKFAIIRHKAPTWLSAAYPGYRFRARINLPDLEEKTGWGYIMDLEPDHDHAGQGG